MISSAHYLRRPTRGPSHANADKLFTRIRVSSRMALPIRFSPDEVAAEAGYRCVISRSSLRSRARPAASSYIRFVWIRRALFIVGRRSEQASLSVRSPMPAAFATILISHEISLSSVTRQEPIARAGGMIGVDTDKSASSAVDVKLPFD